MAALVRSPECDGCRQAAIACIPKGAACAACLFRVCHAALATWDAWFAPPNPGAGASPLATTDAETHSDLASAYGEMDLAADALYEAVLAVSGNVRFAERHGEMILRGLQPAGWTLLRRLGPLN